MPQGHPFLRYKGQGGGLEAELAGTKQNVLRPRVSLRISTSAFWHSLDRTSEVHSSTFAYSPYTTFPVMGITTHQSHYGIPTISDINALCAGSRCVILKIKLLASLIEVRKYIRRPLLERIARIILDYDLPQAFQKESRVVAINILYERVRKPAQMRKQLVQSHKLGLCIERLEGGMIAFGACDYIVTLRPTISKTFSFLVIVEPTRELRKQHRHLPRAIMTRFAIRDQISEDSTKGREGQVRKHKASMSW